VFPSPRLLAALLAVLVSPVVLALPAIADTAAAPSSGWQRQMLVEVNALRAAAGVPELRLCAALGRAARGHARDLASGAPFGHIGTDGRGPGERVRAQGYAWSTVGENVAAGQASVRQAMESWVTSEGHLANLLNPDYRHLGVAVVVTANSPYGSYWVQGFGRGGSCRSRPA
jgi:uncharacterized protein YkwD